MRARKEVRWEGSSRAEIRAFPDEVRQDAGFALSEVQEGREPPDWGPMPEIGSGACEIRVDDGDAYRVIYVAKFEEAVYVLHAFQKKSKSGIATPKNHLDLAIRRYSALVRRRAAEAKAAAARGKSGGTKHR